MSRLWISGPHITSSNVSLKVSNKTFACLSTIPLLIHYWLPMLIHSLLLKVYRHYYLKIVLEIHNMKSRFYFTFLNISFLFLVLIKQAVDYFVAASIRCNTHILSSLCTLRSIEKNSLKLITRIRIFTLFHSNYHFFFWSMSRPFVKRLSLLRFA